MHDVPSTTSLPNSHVLLSILAVLGIDLSSFVIGFGIDESWNGAFVVHILWLPVLSFLPALSLHFRHLGHVARQYIVDKRGGDEADAAKGTLARER